MTLTGYQPFDMVIERKVSGWIAGNIIFGGIIGLAVDIATGGMYKLSPAQVNATLVRQTGALPRLEGDAVYVFTVLRPDPTWERIGTLTPSR